MYDHAVRARTHAKAAAERVVHHLGEHLRSGTRVAATHITKAAGLSPQLAQTYEEEIFVAVGAALGAAMVCSAVSAARRACARRATTHRNVRYSAMGEDDALAAAEAEVLNGSDDDDEEEPKFKF